MRSILVINTRYPLENCIVLRFEQSIKFYLFSLSLSLLLSPFVLSPLFLEREREWGFRYIYTWWMKHLVVWDRLCMSRMGYRISLEFLRWLRFMGILRLSVAVWRGRLRSSCSCCPSTISLNDWIRRRYFSDVLLVRVYRYPV